AVPNMNRAAGTNLAAVGLSATMPMTTVNVSDWRRVYEALLQSSAASYYTSYAIRDWAPASGVALCVAGANTLLSSLVLLVASFVSAAVPGSDLDDVAGAVYQQLSLSPPSQQQLCDPGFVAAVLAAQYAAAQLGGAGSDLAGRGRRMQEAQSSQVLAAAAALVTNLNNQTAQVVGLAVAAVRSRTDPDPRGFRTLAKIGSVQAVYAAPALTHLGLALQQAMASSPDDPRGQAFALAVRQQLLSSFSPTNISALMTAAV
ncbi:hypothetical protein HaLaN_31352, partial [Haematococcus lacustris]